MIDWLLRLPWPNQRRPFVSLHVARCGFQCFLGRWRNVYRVGIGAGVQFSDFGAWRWFDIKGFWRKNKAERSPLPHPQNPEGKGSRA